MAPAKEDTVGINRCHENPLFNQVCGSLGTICIFFTHGYLLALQSIIVPQLRSTSLQLTPEQESWMPSISLLMMFPAQSISGQLSDIYGRKRILIFALIPQIVACLVLYYAKDFTTFLAAFALSGLVGAGMATGSIFMAEISSPTYRGPLINTKIAITSVGMAAAHGLGNFIDWNYLTSLGIFPNLIGLVITLMVPDSPAWLASKGRFKECKVAFDWYRGDQDKEELQKLIEQQEEVLKIKAKCKRRRGFWSRVAKLFQHPGFLKAVALNATTFIFIEACGKQIFIAYAFDTIGSLIQDKHNVFYYALGLDLADALALFVSCLVVKKYSRRFLILVVGAPALVLLVLICLVSFMLTKGYIPDRFSFLSLALLSVYFISLSIAVIPNLYSLGWELYPLSHRGTGVSCSGFLFVTITFVVTKLSPSLLRAYGMSGTLLLNAVVSAMALLHMYYYLPETDNRTLQDIEEQMRGKSQKLRNLDQLEAREKILMCPPYPPASMMTTSSFYKS